MVKYGFIVGNRTVWPLWVMCRVMIVSASGCYDLGVSFAQLVLPDQRTTDDVHPRKLRRQ